MKERIKEMAEKYGFHDVKYIGKWKNKKLSTEGLWDGMRFEIAGAETATPNNIRNALKHCASKRETDVAVVFFPNGVNIDNLRLGISKYNGLRNSGNGQWKQFKDMVFIDQNGIVSQ